MPGFIAKKLCPQVKAGRAVTQPSHSTHTHTLCRHQPCDLVSALTVTPYRWPAAPHPMYDAEHTHTVFMCLPLLVQW